MAQLRFDDQVAVVTGAGNGLGKQYALFLAARGAKVVVNDLGGDIHGKSTGSGGHSKGKTKRVADVVVEQIRDGGGIAVANYDPVQQGARIIQTAIDSFGRIDILVNNAGILRDVILRKMTDSDWDIIMDVHLHGTMKTTQAAWPYFKTQKYGRIVNTTSSSGLFGNFGQSNYAAAKMAIVGLSETSAKEGIKYNIRCNVVAPAAASRLTETVLPPEMMEALQPGWVSPLVGILCHTSCPENGSIFEAGAGHFSKIRWERSRGWFCRPEDMNADLVAQNIDRIADWSNADHPDGPPEPMALLKKAQNTIVSMAKNNLQPISLKGRVALVTGGGAGLGRAYALELSRLGAKVVVCDIQGARGVADEIQKSGNQAYPLKRSVTDDADLTIKEVVSQFGRIDILINNAGVLRDKTIGNMTEDLWGFVVDVNLRSTYKLTKAAWPFFMQQKYGRIVNTTSTSGIYGNFGQSNYAAAKCGVVGFSKTIAREGAKYNIITNTIAPTAGTQLTAGVRDPTENATLRPEFVAPLVMTLVSDKPPTTGQLFEAGAGWFAATRWQRAKGADFDFLEGAPSLERVSKAMPQICDFDNGQADNPDRPEDGSTLYMANIKRASEPTHSKL